MPSIRGFAAAGQHILKKMKPAYLTHYGRAACLLSGCAVLMMSFGYLRSDGSVMPVPPKKPEVMKLVAVPPPAKSNPAPESVGPYRSPYGGEQMDIYRDIFRLQASGSLDDAAKLFKKIKDDSLMGHILAQRYLHPDYKSSFEELKDWLDRYAELPEASRIKRLASIRTPSGYKGTLKEAAYESKSIEELDPIRSTAKTYSPKIKRSKDQENEAAAMIKTIRKQVKTGEPSTAWKTLTTNDGAKYLDDVEKDRLKALIASGFLYTGNSERAEALSAEALKRSEGHAPMAGWIYGLTMYRQGYYAKAASAFEMAASSPYAAPAMAASASFWASRSFEKAGSRRKASHFMEKAADHPRTFYGMLALASLDRTPDFDWTPPKLTSAQEKAILATPAGIRAEKLIAAGEIPLAEAEIRSLYISGNHERKKALLAYAYDRKLPSLTLKLAHALSFDDKSKFDAAMYPAMPWTPNKGYRIDRALIHAIIRQESKFNASAQNKGSGATGLMQLMPKTAGYMADSDIFDDRANLHLLKNPEVSLDIGQKYVEYLLNNSMVGQDLLSLAVAYNAGPGNLAKWKEARKDITDPLLFIETIPFAETRTYVQRVLTNYWVYRLRFDQTTDTMQALASGNWVRYASQDKGAVKFAGR